ncbi:protein-glutamate methylesterase/protein-glutamine glutaminase [Paludibaculum fermentans]|uniref:Protein-glutamate methylesterase/protein-glutamine glutaminase n=1 Tax=Paludibaculum fermentans TaxID=1473598 RepID=A0A7S7NS42_PALFE|nr:chemotaxis response regulator protein-glutamate methylesterase [Paludibaculum fermentans]QOY88654.1 chemotaxis response regulator protein-glutamate methylesterase [Paludibaculum fermentans]
MTQERRTRVLVVDDSAIVRKVLSDILSAQPDLEVVGTAPDPYVARDKILALAPDVLTLDIEMPRMDGLTFLRRIMRFHPLPVIVISSLAQSSTKSAMEALTEGAVDVLAKPGGPYSVGDLKEDLPRRVRAAARSRMPAARPTPLPAKTHAAIGDPRGALRQMVIALGASTGGTQAIERVLTALPAGMPPIVVTQHIPPVFSAAFAERLNKVCALEVREAKGGEVLSPGVAWIAPGDRHLLLDRAGAGWRIRLDDSPKVCYQRPSVDVMFKSVSAALGQAALGVLMTGMGSDGAEGLLAMRKNGAETIAQDEASCVVFGMPREAIRMGAAGQVLSLDAIAPMVLKKSRVTQ